MKIYFYSIEVYDNKGMLVKKIHGSFSANITSIDVLNEAQNEVINNLGLKKERVMFIAFNAV